MHPSRSALVVAAALLLEGPGVRTRAVGSRAAAPPSRAAVRPGAPPDPSWLASARRSIEREEYQVAWQESARALAAPNRAHEVRTAFERGGIRMVPRRAAKGEAARWEWRLRYRGIRGEGEAALLEASPVEPCAEGSRVVYGHERGVTEWFENDERGLEHGFTLASPPEGSVGPLVLELAVEGSLRPALRDGGLDLLDGASAALRYDRLEAADATGRRLAAEMRLAGSSLELRIDARDAAFPITVDPLATSASRVFSGAQLDAHFGWSVASAGDVNGDGYDDVIVGAPQYDDGQTDEGKVFVYLGSPTGPAAAPDWTAMSNISNSQFGFSVASAGDVNGDGFGDIVVGAPSFSQCDPCNQDESGAFFVWYGGSGGLGPNGTPGNADYSVSSFQPFSGRGYAVAPLGDVDGDGFGDIAVATLGGDAPCCSPVPGGVLVLFGSAGGLASAASSLITFAPQNRLLVSGGDFNGDGFADVLVGRPDAASAEIYFGPALSTSAANVWKVTGGSLLGSSVSTAGDVDGDGFADVLVADASGNAFLYRGATGMPETSAAWSAHVGGNLCQVSTAGDVDGDGYADVLVGAPQAGSLSGAAYLWLGGPDGPNGGVNGTAANAPWSVTGADANGQLGFAVACAGDANGDGFSDVLVGEPADAVGGKAFLFLGGAELPKAAGVTLLFGPQATALFGSSAASAGDLNGDGFSDLIIGAPHYDSGQADEGRVFVYYGGPDGPTTAGWIADGNDADAHFGGSVASAGDVNGDGYDDVIIGADQFTGAGNTHQGAAFVWLGGASGLGPSGANPSTADWSAFGGQTSAHLGASVASAGDVNGDGYSDVIVGAPLFSRGQVLEGIALVWLGSAAGLGPDGSLANAAKVLEADQASAGFGSSVASAGDVNRDGFSDVIVGAPAWDVTASGSEGAAFVYLGSAAGLVTPAVWMSTGVTPAEDFGRSVAGAGDVNGDGFSDVVVGAPRAVNGSSQPVGKMFVFRGGATGPGVNATTSRTGTVVDAEFGRSVAGAGDVNGDGFSDVVVGAPKYANGETDEGAAFLYLGGANAMSAAIFTFEGGEAGAQLGSTVAGAGDVNGDGFDDLIVGAANEDFNSTDGGTARVFYGNGAKGVPGRPQQKRIAGGPLARLDASDSHTSFKIGQVTRSPFGRARLQLETEAKPLGTAFDGAGTQIGGFSASAVKTFSVTRTVSPLLPGLRYHWRARTRYSAVTTPMQTHGPWRSLPSAARNETMLRTLPCGGDVNGDASINVGDVFVLINALFAGGPQPSCGDVNSDGTMNIGDVFYLINFLFAGGPPPV